MEDFFYFFLISHPGYDDLYLEDMVTDMEWMLRTLYIQSKFSFKYFVSAKLHISYKDNTFNMNRKSIQIDLKWLFGDGIRSILNWFKHTEDKMVKTESPSSEEELYIRVWYMKWYFGNRGIANMTGRFFCKAIP